MVAGPAGCQDVVAGRTAVHFQLVDAARARVDPGVPQALAHREVASQQHRAAVAVAVVGRADEPRLPLPRVQQARLGPGGLAPRGRLGVALAPDADPDVGLLARGQRRAGPGDQDTVRRVDPAAGPGADADLVRGLAPPRPVRLDLPGQARGALTDAQRTGVMLDAGCAHVRTRNRVLILGVHGSSSPSPRRPRGHA